MRGMFGAPLVATREQEDLSAQLAKRFGVEGVSVTDSVSPYVDAGNRMAQQVAQQMVPQGYTPRKRSLADNLGLLADAFRGTNENGQLLMQQDKEARAAWEAQRQRAIEFADWERKKQWERDNPAPVNNDTVADYEFRKRTLGLEAANEWLRSASDPIVTVTLPGNRVYSGPRSGLATALGSGGNASRRPEIGAVVADPRNAGGAGQGGSRTFPH